MQDPSLYQQIKPPFPEHEHLKCPRCDSSNTKFCYYNNYNLSQPRHFCKNCRRYWTKGGALRNIPVGGGTRKNSKRSSNPKRSSSSSSSSTAAAAAASSSSTSSQSLPKTEHPQMYNLSVSGDLDRRFLDAPGSFSSLLASSGQFGNLTEGMNMNPNGPGLKTVQLGEFAENPNSNAIRNPSMELQNGNNPENFLGIQSGGDSSCWGGGGNGWPDLAIYTPGSSFQ